MMKSKFVLFIVVILFAAQTAYPNVQIVRDDPENPVVSLAKSTAYGALLGSVIALSIMLLTNGDDGDVFKISFVIGTALGLGYGIYHISTRPSGETHALLNIDPDGDAKISVPQLRLGMSSQNTLKTSVKLLAWNF